MARQTRTMSMAFLLTFIIRPLTPEDNTHGSARQSRNSLRRQSSFYHSTVVILLSHVLPNHVTDWQMSHAKVVAVLTVVFLHVVHLHSHGGRPQHLQPISLYLSIPVAPACHVTSPVEPPPQLMWRPSPQLSPPSPSP
jgi:hypothetical protein